MFTSFFFYYFLDCVNEKPYLCIPETKNVDNKLMKRIFLAMVASLCSVALFAQAEDLNPSDSIQRNDSLLMAHLDLIDQQEIPADTSVRQGTLKNGLTY